MQFTRPSAFSFRGSALLITVVVLVMANTMPAVKVDGMCMEIIQSEKCYQRKCSWTAVVAEYMGMEVHLVGTGEAEATGGGGTDSSETTHVVATSNQVWCAWSMCTSAQGYHVKESQCLPPTSRMQSISADGRQVMECFDDNHPAAFLCKHPRNFKCFLVKSGSCVSAVAATTGVCYGVIALFAGPTAGAAAAFTPVCIVLDVATCTGAAFVVNCE